jgi:hypothetical protein
VDRLRKLLRRAAISAYVSVSIRQHTSACVHIRIASASSCAALPFQHTSAYVSIRQQASAYGSPLQAN